MKATQSQLDAKNLRFYADLFKSNGWDTPQLDTSVFVETLRGCAERVETATDHIIRLREALHSVLNYLNDENETG